MWLVRRMVWRGVCAGRMAFRVAERWACCSARRVAGRDDRSSWGGVLRAALSLSLVRFLVPIVGREGRGD